MSVLRKSLIFLVGYPIAKPYETFFSVLVVLIFAPFVYGLGMVFLIETAIPFPWTIPVLLICALGSVTIVLNLGEGPHAPANIVFWVWLGFSGGLVVLGLLGRVEVILFSHFFL